MNFDPSSFFALLLKRPRPRSGGARAPRARRAALDTTAEGLVFGNAARRPRGTCRRKTEPHTFVSALLRRPRANLSFPTHPSPAAPGRAASSGSRCRRRRFSGASRPRAKRRPPAPVGGARVGGERLVAPLVEPEEGWHRAKRPAKVLARRARGRRPGPVAQPRHEKGLHERREFARPAVGPQNDFVVPAAVEAVAALARPRLVPAYKTPIRVTLQNT